MRLDFTGRHVVVTGGSGELGAATVRLLASSGAICHIPVRSPGKIAGLFDDLGGSVRPAPVPDLADEAAVSAFYASLPELWASIHAAGAFAMGPFTETSLSDFQKMHTVNTVSAFLCSREAAKKMPGGGRIVNVAAAAALDARRGAGMVAYAVSKAAVAALTVALAEELAAKSVWVNAVVPSTMDTKANRAAMPNAEFAKWPKLDEVAATVAFLASPQNAVTRAALVPVFGKS